MPKLSELFNGSWQKWKYAKAEREKTVAERLLPDDLREQLLEGVDRERAWLLDRLEVIAVEIERAKEKLELIKKSERGALSAVVPPLVRFVALDGHEEVKPKYRTDAHVVTKEAIEARKAFNGWRYYLQQFEAEKAGRLSELRELRQLDQQLQAGQLTVLARAVEHWHVIPVMGALARLSRIGVSLTEGEMIMPSKADKTYAE